MGPFGDALLKRDATDGQPRHRSQQPDPVQTSESVAAMLSHPQYLTLLPKESGEIIVQIGKNRHVRHWDERAAAILGYRAEEVVDRPYERLLSDRQRSAHSFQRMLNEVNHVGAPRTFEFEHRTKDDQTTLLRGVASVMRSKMGDLDGWLLVMHRAVEECCLDCRLLFYLEAITSESADAIIILDEEDRIQSWNRGAEDIYGFVAEEVVGRPVEILFPRELLEAGELDFLRKTIREVGFIRNFETTRVTRDGHTIPVELTRSAIRDSHGHVIGCSAIVRDISKRKMLEERLLHTERLAVVGRMAAQVAHELRNPLSSISLNAELLTDELSVLPDDLTEEARGLLSSMVKEIERLAAVSEEYLQFARLPELAPAPTDVILLVEDLAEFTELEMTKAGVSVRVETAEVPDIPVDRKQLRQALLNLIRNALEAMNDGGTLTLQTTLVDKGSAVEIAVMDTGHGVGSDQETQIFEPFFSTKEGGNGLGLSLARRVAHEHGGELIYRPTPGGGSTFALRLPAREEDIHERK